MGALEVDRSDNVCLCRSQMGLRADSLMGVCGVPPGYAGPVVVAAFTVMSRLGAQAVETVPGVVGTCLLPAEVVGGIWVPREIVR